jgi:chemotaxis protein methyltransferase WspC
MISLRTLLQRHTGLRLGPADIERAVRERTGRRDAAAQQAYAPLPGTAEFDALLDLLVVPESWILRDPPVFDHALRFVQARLLARPHLPVRILSLPCAAGEEPYSMAMLLANAGIDPRQCRIDAVDLSAGAIARARAGRFGRNAFRGTNLAFRTRWFRRSGDDYHVDPLLAEYIAFSQGNLFSLPPEMAACRYDFIFCRNLLIYFDDDACARAARRLAALLADDGELVSGYAEAPTLCAHGFVVPSLHAPYALAKAPPAMATPAASGALAAIMANARAAAPAPPPEKDDPPARAPDAASAAALLAQARCDADEGRLAEAQLACEALLSAAPDCAEAYYLLGLLAECAGQDGAAQGHWQRCLYLDPDHYEALCGLALLHEQRGDAELGADLRRRAARVFARRGSAA